MSVILLGPKENPHIYRPGKCYCANDTALVALPVRLLPWLDWQGMFFYVICFRLPSLRRIPHLPVVLPSMGNGSACQQHQTRKTQHPISYIWGSPGHFAAAVFLNVTDRALVLLAQGLSTRQTLGSIGLSSRFVS